MLGEAIPRPALVLQPAGIPDAAADAAAAPPLDASSADAAGPPAPTDGSRGVRALLSSCDGSSMLTASTDMVLRSQGLRLFGTAPSTLSEPASRRSAAGGRGCRRAATTASPSAAARTARRSRPRPRACCPRALSCSRRRRRLTAREVCAWERRSARDSHASNVAPVGGGASEADGGGTATPLPSSHTPAGEAGPLGGGSGECHAAITALVYCATQQPGLLIAGSLDGIVHVWR